MNARRNVGLVLILVGVVSIFLSLGWVALALMAIGALLFFAKTKDDPAVMMKNSKGKMVEKPTNYCLASIIISAIRIALSVAGYLGMVYGDGPWSEGRVYYSFFAIGDLFWLIVCIILNIMGTRKKISNGLVIASWVLLIPVVVLMVMMVLYRPE